jgi:hypothetical protein
MIIQVRVKYFKCFDDEQFDLQSHIVLAGPNNMGKSTLLQAIMTWKLGLDRWSQQRRGGSATKRTGVPIGRHEFTAIPLREMNLMWSGRTVSGERGSASRRIEITLCGIEGEDTWEYGLEFEYANPEMMYVRPLGAKERGVSPVPDGARALQIVHIPALAGIERDEKRHDPGYQDHLIGQGRAGEILRNLLLEISEDVDRWAKLAAHVKQLFDVELLPPRYSPAQPFIIAEYQPGAGKALDLTCAGSGMLQVLLILAFFYARPATVLLMDEPDAHLHVILQEQVYAVLRKIAYERGSQLIIATHSVVLLDATSPDQVLAFIGEHPRLLTERWQRNGLRQAIRSLTTTDLLLARDVGAVLYVEGESDERILKEWAQLLGHRCLVFFERPYVHHLHTRSLRDASSHFFALKAVNPGVRGVCLLDGDNRDEPDDETKKAGLRILRWRRYEIENYLVVPAALLRFCEREEPELFASHVRRQAEAFLREQLPPVVFANPFTDSPTVSVIKASEDILIPLLAHVHNPLSKGGLYLIAAIMTIEEIHPEVCEKLDAIAGVLLPKR